MRHFLANVATYAISILLVAGAVVFGWLRSGQVVITRESAVVAAYDPGRDGEFVWAELGRDSYLRNCANCHGQEGDGWDQYPGLDHTGQLFVADGGREYVIDLHLYGLASRRWRAPMPPMGHIGDVEMAAVINHVLTLRGGEDALSADAPLLAPGDIDARRGRRLSPNDVDRRRPAVQPEEATGAQDPAPFGG